jgi:hypothetical protein
MFIKNKYTIWYFRIIENAKSQKRTKDHNFERHHIIPRCMNGTDDNDNLVYLTHREHYVCHLILCKMVQDRQLLFKLVKAVLFMQNTRIVTSRQYEFIKLYSHQVGTDHPLHGRPISQSHKANISKAQKGTRIGQDNPMFGMSGEKNPCSRAVIIAGITYASLKLAAEALNVHTDTIKYRIRTKDDYAYASERTRNIKPAPKKPVMIDGIRYDSRKEASVALQMLPETVGHRLKSPNFPNWYYITS